MTYQLELKNSCKIYDTCDDLDILILYFSFLSWDIADSHADMAALCYFVHHLRRSHPLTRQHPSWQGFFISNIKDLNQGLYISNNGPQTWTTF